MLDSTELEIVFLELFLCEYFLLFLFFKLSLLLSLDLSLVNPNSLKLFILLSKIDHQLLPFGHHLFDLIFFAQVHNFGHIECFSSSLQITADSKSTLLFFECLSSASQDLFFHYIHADFTCRFLLVAFVCFALCECFSLVSDSLCVNVVQNELQLLEMTVCDHSVCFVEDENVDHWESVQEVGLLQLIDEFPKTSWRGYYYRWAI